MAARYELFDHTADMGIRAYGATLPELVAAAREGFYATIGELAAAGEALPAALEHSGEGWASLLRDYLARLLLLFECEHRMVMNEHVTEFTESRLVVQARTASVDEQQSVYYREVKAVTYHELAVERIDGEYRATIIVDI